MTHSPDIIYTYDGTIEGLFCCVFESFYQKETPVKIMPEDEQQMSLVKTRHIETDTTRAKRVAESIPAKISPEAMELVSLCFLTCLPDKERIILDFLRKGYKYGAKVVDMLTDDTVHLVHKSVGHMGKEAHHLKGFIRFSVYGAIKISIIKPKNFVLPLIREHFCDRFQNEAFMIYDESHGCALVYKPRKSAIIPVNELVLEQPGEEELKYQKLWKEYYDTIAIKERYNPKCRMTLMPKRYWDYMTEFDSPAWNKY